MGMDWGGCGAKGGGKGGKGVMWRGILGRDTGVGLSSLAGHITQESITGKSQMERTTSDYTSLEIGKTLCVLSMYLHVVS